MPSKLTKFLSLFLSLCLILEQSAFAQSLDLSAHFANFGRSILQTDKFRPLHLRYISYDSQANDFKLLLDKGDTNYSELLNSPNSLTPKLEQATQELMRYFFIGLSLPNDKFWVNLRPDSPDNILDPDLEKTDIGRIFLEADLQLKKDTASFTSPQTPEGKDYWDKLYQKARELFGTEPANIPTITRPWIVPNEIIIREFPEGAYIYKATLKVMLEEDYLKSNQKPVTRNQIYPYIDPRMKELNEYSTQLIRENIIPKLTYEVNTSRRYAPLRQVYYSLILAQWFKARFGKSVSQSAGERVSGLAGKPVNSLTGQPANPYIKLIDSRDLTNLTSKELYDKQTYFRQYQRSFKDGEYNLSEPAYTPIGQSIRRYVSGGAFFGNTMSAPVVIASNTFHPKKNNDYLIIGTSSPVTGALKLFRNALKPHNLDPTVQDLLKRFSDGNVRKMIEREFLGRTDSTEQAIRLLTLLKNIKYKFEGENLTPDQSIVEGWLINALLRVSDYSNDFYYGIAESYLKNLAEFEKKLRDKTFREAFLDLFYNRDIGRLGEPVARRRELPKTGFYSINDYSEINYALSIPTDNIVITHNARDEENFLEHIVKVLESAGVSIEKIEIPKTLFNKRLSPRKLPPAAEVVYHIKSDPYFELRVRLRDRSLKSIRGYFGEKNSFSYIPAGSLISLNGIGLDENFIAQMPLGEMVMFEALRSAEVLRLWGFAPVQGQEGIFVKIAQLSEEELSLLLNAQGGISPCFYPLFDANKDLIEIRNRVKEIVNKILASSSSPINQERLDNLLNNLREETITAVIDRKVKEIFEMLEEDDLLILSKEQIILLVTKMKQCSENFSTNFFLDNLFLASRMDAKELLSLFLELTYSVSSRELRDNLLHAIDYAINVHEVIRLSQKQFDDLINFIKWYLPKNANTYSARGSIANMLGATLDQEEIKISQEQLNNVIEALGDLDITIDDISILTSTGPDYLAIAAGMGFVTKAIKKNKELVMNQQHFDILLKTLPKIIQALLDSVWVFETRLSTITAL